MSKVAGKEASDLLRWGAAERASALKRIVSPEAVKQALRRSGRPAGVAFNRGCCHTRLSDWLVVLIVIGLGLFCRDSYRQIHRWLRPWNRRLGVPGRSTLCEARKRIGVAPLIHLARAVIKPLATQQQMPQAFYAGLRLMAQDGFVLNLPDTPDNARVFGRPGGPSPGAFPQVRVLALCEAGTHALLHWIAKPQRISETAMTPALLKHLPAGALLMWDQGFRGQRLVKRVLLQKSDLLARGRAHEHLTSARPLSDGSYIARLYASDADRRKDRNGLKIRVIDYTLDDPSRVGHRKRHRLITTLLDERAHPATTLIDLYHVRWEEELAIDEIKTHEMQRPTLRSQTPGGVIQELWGLMLSHYVLRGLMAQAAQRASVPPTALSFTATLKILQCRLPTWPGSASGQRVWSNDLLEEIAAEQLEPRRNRINPRVVRVQLSKWPRKRKKHEQWPQPIKEFRDCIVVER